MKAKGMFLALKAIILVIIVCVLIWLVVARVTSGTAYAEGDDNDVYESRRELRLATKSMDSAPKPVVYRPIPQKKESTRVDLGGLVKSASEKMNSLDWVRDHLDLWYTGEEIRQTALIVQAEDLIAYSDTVWSAHVWVVVSRVKAPGFTHNDSIIDVLSAPGQFSTYTQENLSKEVVPEVERIVRDVFARKILEDMGAPPEEVGRTMPATHLFFNMDGLGGKYNIFYRYCWGDPYDPFDAPFNPYDN